MPLTKSPCFMLRFSVSLLWTSSRKERNVATNSSNVSTLSREGIYMLNPPGKSMALFF
ncbi:hypothetical protein D3C81_1856590 [compost metagenome]